MFRTGRIRMEEISEWYLLLRMLCAGACGAVLGLERRLRKKGAGIRMHMLTAVSAALMTVVSQYGFSDLEGAEGIRFGPAGIVAYIVSGSSFLCAGAICVYHQAVRGLTTAAGLWASVGIGIAAGCGLYLTAAGTTVLVFLSKLLPGGQKRSLPIKDDICGSN